MCIRPPATLLILLIWPVALGAQATHTPALDVQTTQDLKRLTIEELSQLDVTSVSRRPERVSDAPAAVSVIRTEDLRRSGVTSLAEAMRLATGVDVARVNPNTWAVTARGFNISTANKLLVLIDGRTVYSPLFSGTFWEVQDMLLDDVDRIEVVRGPGGATWGANAMNGVINIITRHTAETRGSYLLGASGTDEHVILSARHGGRSWNGGDYRIFGKFRQRGAGVNAATGDEAGNELLMGRGGFRLDSDERPASRWMLQGEIYRAEVGMVARPDGDLAGGHLMGRYMRRFSSSSEFTAQAYYDYTWRRIPLQFEEHRSSVDLDVQHTMLLGRRHHLVVGGEIWVSHGNDRGVAGFFFDPEERTNDLFSFFAQDEITIRPDRLFLILGSKFEDNDYTGLEVQPTARVRWTRHSRETIWAAVSRAVRLPTRFDTDLRIVNPATKQILISGSPDFDSESVVAYEAGYRVQPHPLLALDVAVYANRYDDLRSQELPTVPGGPITLRNSLNATTSGIEVSATAQATDAWRVFASYSYLYEDFSVDPGSTDRFDGAFEANDPSHLFSLRSYLSLPAGFELDGFFRAVASRPNPEVPAYAELDLRLGWIARPGWEISLVGQNLLHARHAELFSSGAPRYEFERGVFLRSAWRF